METGELFLQKKSRPLGIQIKIPQNDLDAHLEDVSKNHSTPMIYIIFSLVE